LGPKEERMLISGLHIVSDVYCRVCQRIIGWKYVHAFNEQEKYKEGSYIIEKARIRKEYNKSC
jgi:Yippee zinc-binding/DNA-binding /Mis18, centromere assembly